jgi:uncharacterized membrane protein YkoI
MKISVLIITVLLAMPVTAISGKHPHRMPVIEANSLFAEAETTRSVNVSAGAAAAKVQKRYGGKILSVKLGKNRVAYRVKILTDAGVVRIVTVDASSGRIVN